MSIFYRFFGDFFEIIQYLTYIYLFIFIFIFIFGVKWRIFYVLFNRYVFAMIYLVLALFSFLSWRVFVSSRNFIFQKMKKIENFVIFRLCFAISSK